MRALATGWIVAALACAPAGAQTYNGTQIAQKMRPRFTVLTVLYPSIANTKMTLTSSAGTFKCVPPGLPLVTLLVTCKLNVPRGQTVSLKANWLIFSPIAQTGNGKPITGKQWLEACAGTIGDTCTLDMSVDKSVTINPN